MKLAHEKAAICCTTQVKAHRQAVGLSLATLSWQRTWQVAAAQLPVLSRNDRLARGYCKNTMPAPPGPTFFTHKSQLSFVRSFPPLIGPIIHAHDPHCRLSCHDPSPCARIPTPPYSKFQLRCAKHNFVQTCRLLHHKTVQITRLFLKCNTAEICCSTQGNRNRSSSCQSLSSGIHACLCVSGKVCVCVGGWGLGREGGAASSCFQLQLSPCKVDLTPRFQTL